MEKIMCGGDLAARGEEEEGSGLYGSHEGNLGHIVGNGGKGGGEGKWGTEPQREGGRGQGPGGRREGRPTAQDRDRDKDKASIETGRRLVAVLNEVVGEALDGVGALAGLDGLVVEANEDALASLDEDGATSAALGVEGAVVGAEEEVLLASNVETVGTEGSSISEATAEGLSLGAGDVQAGSGGPEGTVEAEDGALGDETGTWRGQGRVEEDASIIMEAKRGPKGAREGEGAMGDVASPKGSGRVKRRPGGRTNEVVVDVRLPRHV